MKKCNRCLLEKQESEFPKNGNGTHSHCKDCKNSYKRKWYNDGGQKWELEYKVFSRKSRSAQYLCAKAKQRARLKNLPFNITPEDIIVPEFCPILGIPLVSGDKNICDNSPTLDRIKPELGYIKGNIQILSARANMLKSNATIEELEKVLEHLKKIV